MVPDQCVTHLDKHLELRGKVMRLLKRFAKLMKSTMKKSSPAMSWICEHKWVTPETGRSVASQVVRL